MKLLFFALLGFTCLLALNEAHDDGDLDFYDDDDGLTINEETVEKNDSDESTGEVDKNESITEDSDGAELESIDEGSEDPLEAEDEDGNVESSSDVDELDDIKVNDDGVKADIYTEDIETPMEAEDEDGEQQEMDDNGTLLDLEVTPDEVDITTDEDEDSLLDDGTESGAGEKVEETQITPDEMGQFSIEDEDEDDDHIDRFDAQVATDDEIDAERIEGGEDAEDGDNWKVENVQVFNN